MIDKHSVSASAKLVRVNVHLKLDPLPVLCRGIAAGPHVSSSGLARTATFAETPNKPPKLERRDSGAAHVVVYAVNV